MSDKPPYFPLYVLDFAASGKVEAMSTEAVGAYILLLCKAWHATPPCSLPNDDPTLARWSRLGNDDWSRVKASVVAAWELRADGRLYQTRLEIEWRKFRELQRARSEAGRRGGNARALSLAEPKQSHSNAIAKLQHAGLTLDSGSESEISLSELRKQAGEKMRADCAREKPPDSGDSPFMLALADWSKAARIGWNSACDNAVAAWWMQTLPMLSLPPDPPDALERIVAALRRKGTDFRSVKFALACVRSAVEEWTRTGVPPWVTAPSGGGKVAETPKERAARLVAARQNGTHQ